METIRIQLKIGILSSVILLTLSALAWGQNDASNHRVTLTSAVVNGFDITEARTILVDPDSPLEGEILELEPVADTFISSSNYTTWVGNKRIAERYANFGTNSGLSVIKGLYTGGESFYNWRGTLIRFDLSAFPEDAEILEAKLFLYHYSVWGQLISIHRMNQEWTELGASWWQPCEGCETWWYGWDDGNYVRAATDTQWVASINRWFSWDVTGDVQLFVNGAPNDGWFLKSAEKSGSDWTSASFYSKETHEREFVPYLRVRFQVPQPPAVTLTAVPDSIQAGDSSTLSWSSAHADSAVIDPAIGNVPVNGSMTVSPNETTTYTITVQGPGGSATASATVTVSSSQPPSVTFSADPTLIVSGQASTLSWTTTHATACSIEPGIGSVPVNGSIEVRPSRSTTYRITVTGPGGETSAEVRITVIS